MQREHTPRPAAVSRPSRASSRSLLGASESAPSGLGCGAFPAAMHANGAHDDAFSGARPCQLSLFGTSRAIGEALASVLTTAVAVHKGAHVARAAPRSAQNDVG